jgi:hypothetical protein
MLSWEIAVGVAYWYEIFSKHFSKVSAKGDENSFHQVLAVPFSPTQWGSPRSLQYRRQRLLLVIVSGIVFWY